MNNQNFFAFRWEKANLYQFIQKETSGVGAAGNWSSAGWPPSLPHPCLSGCWPRPQVPSCDGEDMATSKQQQGHTLTALNPEKRGPLSLGSTCEVPGRISITLTWGKGYQGSPSEPCSMGEGLLRGNGGQYHDARKWRRGAGLKKRAHVHTLLFGGLRGSEETWLGKSGAQRVWLLASP